MDLLEIFTLHNQAHFEGQLDPPLLRWNSRLRSSAGRFVPGVQRRTGTGRVPEKLRPWLSWIEQKRPPAIEVASYLKTLEGGEEHVRQTIAHEMIHYWLWLRRRPYGHTPEFYAKMEAMGAPRYNPVPLKKTPKYIYLCDGCAKAFPAQRKLGLLACLECCKTHSGGKFDIRFKLRLDQTLR